MTDRDGDESIVPVTRLAVRDESGQPPPDLDALSRRIGAKLRLKRKQAGLTLAAAAAQAGISLSSLSRMERSEQSITVIELIAFGAIYHCEATDFFLTDDVQPVKLTRRHERVRSIRNNTSEGPVLQERLINAANVRMGASVIFVPAKGGSGGPLTDDADEMLVVIDGSLRVTVAGTIVDLDLGDTVYYDADQPHEWVNPDERPCTFLMVNCPHHAAGYHS
jgi:XRE family transcriptional regulator, regulator of sulfur utilization